MKIHPPHRRPSAFSLIEVVIALGLMTFVLTNLLALTAVGLTSNQSSRGSMEATRTALAVLADLRDTEADANGVLDSPRFQIPFANNETDIMVLSEEGEDAKRVKVLFISRPGGGAGQNGLPQRGLYETVVQVTWGLPPAATVPPNYGKTVRVYGAIAK